MRASEMAWERRSLLACAGACAVFGALLDDGVDEVVRFFLQVRNRDCFLVEVAFQHLFERVCAHGFGEIIIHACLKALSRGRRGWRWRSWR